MREMFIESEIQESLSYKNLFSNDVHYEHVKIVKIYVVKI